MEPRPYNLEYSRKQLPNYHNLMDKLFSWIQEVVTTFVHWVAGLLEAHAPDISYDNSESIYYM